MIGYLIYFSGVFVAYMVVWSIAHQINKSPDTKPHEVITKWALLTWIPAISLFSWPLIVSLLIYAIAHGLFKEINKRISKDWLNSEI